MKTCTKCKESKILSSFGKRSLSKDGLDVWCKLCKQGHDKEKQFTPNYEGTKVCSTCKIKKEKIEFDKDHRISDGLEGRCKACGNIRSYKNDVKRKYNLTIEQYNALLLKQDNKCAICFTDSPGINIMRFAVDHDHATSQVRGLLCSWCNTGLGQFKDNISLLENAIKYLKVKNGSKNRNQEGLI